MTQSAPTPMETIYAFAEQVGRMAPERQRLVDEMLQAMANLMNYDRRKIVRLREQK